MVDAVLRLQISQHEVGSKSSVLEKQTPKVAFCFKGKYKVGISGKTKRVIQNGRKDNFKILNLGKGLACFLSEVSVADTSTSSLH